jgi:hypothetical protein
LGCSLPDGQVRRRVTDVGKFLITVPRTIRFDRFKLLRSLEIVLSIAGDYVVKHSQMIRHRFRPDLIASRGEDDSRPAFPLLTNELQHILSVGQMPWIRLHTLG